MSNTSMKFPYKAVKQAGNKGKNLSREVVTREIGPDSTFCKPTPEELARYHATRGTSKFWSEATGGRMY